MSGAQQAREKITSGWAHIERIREPERAQVTATMILAEVVACLIETIEQSAAEVRKVEIERINDTVYTKDAGAI